jgi:hypothetical protein
MTAASLKRAVTARGETHNADNMIPRLVRMGFSFSKDGSQ